MYSHPNIDFNTKCEYYFCTQCCHFGMKNEEESVNKVYYLPMCSHIVAITIYLSCICNYLQLQPVFVILK